MGVYMDDETAEKKESAKESNEITDLQLTLSILKKYGPWIILGIIIIAGFWVRSYHLSYPVVGYHNWKETHYLTEARNFAQDGFFRDGLFIPHWDYPGAHDPSSGAHGDSFPTGPLVTSLFFMLFGPSLVVARLVSIFFVLGAVLCAFLIVRRLFARTDLALATAAFMALNPLLVFFGRSGADVINAGLFFLLLGVYLYLRWIEKPSYKNLVGFSLCVTLGLLSKYPNALMGIPMAAIFPWERLVKKEQFKKFWKHLLIFALIFFLIFVWVGYSSYVSKKLGTLDVGTQVRLVDFGVLFTGEFWQVMRAFAADNFTLPGVVLALLSALLFCIRSIRSVKNWSRSEQGVRFMLAYLAGAVLWFVVMSFKLKGHSYHQYPLVFLFSFLLAYGAVFVAASLAKLPSLIGIKKASVSDGLKYVVLLSAVLLFFSAAETAWQRQFNTQFIGLDLAGNYIREHSSPDETIFHPSHQSYGVLWHADRKGYRLTKNLTLFKEIENERNPQWIFLYQWGLQYLEEKEVWNYIRQHYSLAQFAYTPTPRGNMPIYLLFHRGGTFNESQLGAFVDKSQQQIVEYDFIGGKQRLFYAEVK